MDRKIRRGKKNQDNLVFLFFNLSYSIIKWNWIDIYIYIYIRNVKRVYLIVDKRSRSG